MGLTTPLLLRPWRASDRPALREAIDESLAEVQRWLPWGKEEPSTPQQLAARIATYATDFAEHTAWRFALLDEGTNTLLGSGALLPYPGPGALEVGYWIRTGAAGRGLATRTAAALVRHAFTAHQVTRMELWTLVGNEPSMAVARRLGFAFRERRTTSRAGRAPETFEIFDLSSLAALTAPPDDWVRIEQGPARD